MSDPGEYDEAVFAVVDQIPAGSVLSYGDIAELLGGFGPRRVALAMTRSVGAVPWHRVVRADGSPAPQLAHEQLARLRAEATPLRGDRVDMALARWAGGDSGGPAAGPVSPP